MRIACIHIPQYALQCATRLDPALRGAAVAVASSPSSAGSGPLHAPIIVACSRAAWALGVRLGMTATAARSTSADVRVVAIEPALERETVRAIAEAVLGLTPVVDVGGRVGAGGAHLAMYAEVPAKTRGTTFGERVIERLEALGLTGRIGIADDRFTAWVAAAYAGSSQRSDEAQVTAVPRGGSAAFLAPRPLTLLAISPEVQHVLEALGVRTLGEFASLPAPSASVARPLEADYQALARGDSGTLLRPYVPEAPIREQIVVGSWAGVLAGSESIATIARRIALRLAGRARVAVKLEVKVGDALVPIELDHALPSADELERALAPAVPLTPEGVRVAVAIVGEAVLGDEAATVETPSVFAVAAAERSAETHGLSTLLATPGSLFALASPHAAQRASASLAHRRTRRGKRRARTLAGQARLFERG